MTTRRAFSRCVLGVAVAGLVLLGAGMARAQDFNLSYSPSPLIIAPVSEGNVTVTVTDENGFHGAVTLTLNVCSSSVIGACYFTSDTIIGNGSTTLKIYSKTITGTGFVSFHASGGGEVQGGGVSVEVVN